MIGSHDSMTYLPVKQWYLKPFKFMAKCQSKTLYEQFVDYGVRLFDFRVRFDKNLDPIMAHGPIEFKGDPRDYLEELNKLAGKLFGLPELFKDTALLLNKPVHVRLILESNKEMKNQETQELLFQEFCEYCIHKYPNLIFFGGNRKYDWEVVYEFPTNVELQDMYSSTTNIFGGSKEHWTAKLDDIWPWLYARLYNKRNIKRYVDTTKILFIDYINIR